MSKLNIDELLKILPKLIRESDEIKGAIISALSGVVATHEDIVQLNKAMDKRFEALIKQMNERFESMDKRFEAVDKRFESMDKRFESMDKRFESLTKQMNDRFEAVDKRFESMDKRFESLTKQMNERFEATDKRFEAIETHFHEIKSTLKSLQKTLGKPFEQFGRNVVIKLLQSEGIENVTLEKKILQDPEKFVSPGITEVEIDGFSINPPILVEITSILKTKEKIETFLRKKTFVEKLYGVKFKGYFLAASTEFSAEEMGALIIKLKENNCELINL
ncbi:MAG: hypothetical protein ACTSUN_11760 [Promethearchaeota archaeon]